MSENYRFYLEELEELRVASLRNRPLRKQVVELLLFVRECEAAWDLRGQVARTGEDK